MEILAIVPARGGSKGIPHKNIIDLCGKPLINYTLDAINQSKMITRSVVSTDDLEIAEVSNKIGFEVKLRPEELAKDDTPMYDVVDWILSQYRKEQYYPDYFLILQPTSPLRTGKHIDEALSILLEDSKADALVSVIPLPHLYSPVKIMEKKDDGYLGFFIKGGEKYTTRQLMPQYYARNGAAIYAVKTDIYLSTHNIYGTKCLAYVMKEIDSVDIDEQDDLLLAEYYLKKKSN